MLPLIFFLRYFSGSAWSNADEVSFWLVAIAMIGYVVVSERYKPTLRVVSNLPQHSLLLHKKETPWTPCLTLLALL
jgi:hypothetical protein